MAQKIFLNLFICFLLHQQISTEEQKCVQINPCLCRFNSYEKIDLSPLAKEDFFNVTVGNFIYFYHVCEDIDLDSKHCGVNVTNTCTKASVKIANYDYVT